MAVRFVNPISTPYESQFVPLPIEYMAKNLEAKQKAFDEGTQTISQQVFDLPDVPWTTNANVLAQPFIQERDKILTNLQQTGNVNQALLQMNNLKKNWTNNERVKQQLEYINQYEQLKPIYQKDPNLLQTGWDPNFMQNIGQWTKRDWTTQAEEFDALRGQMPALHGDQIVKYLSDNVGERLKGTTYKNKIVKNATWDKTMGKFKILTEDNMTHEISPEDPWTSNAIENWASLINDETVGNDITERYIREGLFSGLKNDKESRKFAIKELIKSRLSPFYTTQAQSSVTADYQSSGYTQGDNKTKDYQFYRSSSIPQLQQQSFDDMYITMGKIQDGVRQKQSQAIDIGLTYFGKDVNFLREVAAKAQLFKNFNPSMIPNNYQLTQGSDMWNEINEIIQGDPTLIPVKDSSGKVNFFTKKEIVLNEINNRAVKEYASLQNNTDPQSIAKIADLSSIVENITSAYTLSEQYNEYNNIVQAEELKFRKTFIQSNDWKDVIENIYTGAPISKLTSKFFGPQGRFEDASDLKRFISANGGDKLIEDIILDNEITTISKYPRLNGQRKASQFFTQTTGSVKSGKGEVAISSPVETDEDLVNNKLVALRDILLQGLQDKRSEHKVTSTISEGVSYSVGGSAQSVPVRYTSELLGQFKRQTLPAILTTMFGSQFDAKSPDALKQIFNSPQISSRMDPGFDLDNTTLAAGVGLEYDVDAVDGPHIFYSIKDKDNRNAEVRLKMDPQSISDFKQNIVIPMIQDENLQTSEAGIALLVQLEMDNDEKNILRLLTSSYQMPTEYLNKEFDVNFAGSTFKFDVISTSSSIVIVDKKTNDKISVTKNNYRGATAAMAALIRKNLPKK